jgi:hypothetical protein
LLKENGFEIKAVKKEGRHKRKTAKAIEHYEKFLSLWKDADPGNVEIEDTRKELAGLRGFN